jgi:outer membrane protein assembly factor BamB
MRFERATLPRGGDRKDNTPDGHLGPWIPFPVGERIALGFLAERELIMLIKAVVVSVAVSVSALGVTAGPVGAVASNPGTACKGDWSMYGDGPAINSVNRCETTLGTGNVAGLHQLYTLTGLFPGEVWLPYQLVVGNMAYAVDQVTSRRSVVEGYSLSTHNAVFKRTIITQDNVDNYVPAVSNGVLFVGGSSTMYAFNALTGRPVWSTPVAGSPQFGPVVVSSSIVYANNMAFNAKTGAVLWTAAVPDVDTVAVYSPAVSNGVVYYDTDRLSAFNAKTGAPVFASNVTASGLPVVSNGVVFVQDAAKLYAFSASTGALRWTAPTGQTDVISAFNPAVDGNTVVMSTPDDVIAVSAASGARLWDYHAVSSDFFTPAIANGVVYVSSISIGLQAFNEATGAQLYSTSGSVIGDSLAVVSHGAVYVTLENGVTAFGL